MPNYPGRRKGTRRIVISVRGKPVERVVEGSKRDADAYEARLRLELEADALSNRTAPTFSDFSTRQYTPHAKRNLKASTWQGTRKYSLANLIQFFGAVRLNELTTALVETFKEERLRVALPQTVNNDLAVLGHVLKWADTNGYPVSKPKIVWLKVRGNPRVKFWTLREIEKLLEAARAHSPLVLRLFVFLLNTGCRKGEAIVAEWEWIDLDAGMVRIPSNAAWQPKSGRPREIPLADSLRAALSGARDHERWLFPNRNGERFREFPKATFREVRDTAGLKGGAHTFRHTFASHFLQAPGTDLFLLGQVMGHSHGRVTELYAHLQPDHLARARNAVNIGPALAVAQKLGEPHG